MEISYLQQKVRFWIIEEERMKPELILDSHDPTSTGHLYHSLLVFLSHFSPSNSLSLSLLLWVQRERERMMVVVFRVSSSLTSFLSNWSSVTLVGMSQREERKKKEKREKRIRIPNHKKWVWLLFPNLYLRELFTYIRWVNFFKWFIQLLSNFLRIRCYPSQEIESE